MGERVATQVECAIQMGYWRRTYLESWRSGVADRRISSTTWEQDGVSDGSFSWSWWCHPISIKEDCSWSLSKTLCEIGASIFLKHKGSPTKSFGTVRQKNFYWKSWYYPLRHKIFRYPKLSEPQKGSSTKWFGTVRQNNFDGKSWYTPPLLYLTIFDIRNFLKHRRVPLRSFSVLSQQILYCKSWYPSHRI